MKKYIPFLLHLALIPIFAYLLHTKPHTAGRTAAATGAAEHKPEQNLEFAESRTAGAAQAPATTQPARRTAEGETLLNATYQGEKSAFNAVLLIKAGLFFILTAGLSFVYQRLTEKEQEYTLHHCRYFKGRLFAG